MSDNKSFELEPKFIADKIMANFLDLYTEWRYLNHIDSTTVSGSLVLTKNNNVSLNLENGRIKIGFRSKLSAIFQAWAYFTILFLSSFTFRISGQTRYIFFFSLTKEQIYKNGDAEEFSRFIRHDRFTFNQESQDEVYLVECKKKIFGRINSKDLRITRYIPLYIFRNRLVLREKVKVIVESFKSALKFTVMLPTCDWLSLFVKEIVLEGPIFQIGINSSNLEYKLVTTQSHLFTRPLIFYWHSKIEKSMIWYSSNSYPILKTDDEFEDYERTQFETSEIDVHYVWSKAHANFIEERNRRKVLTKVVGSIIFQPIHKLDERKLDANCIKITYFDVTPTRIWYHQNGFYSEANMAMTLLSITKVIREIEAETSIGIKLSLKPKRKFRKGHHSDTYKNVVDSLVSSREIEILGSNVDLYSLVSKSDIVLVVPFSSPCLIANEMDVPNAYYSPNSEFKLENPEEEIKLLLSEGELKKFILLSIQTALRPTNKTPR
jgi:hypothetical protein